MLYKYVACNVQERIKYLKALSITILAQEKLARIQSLTQGMFISKCGYF
jgi:hypothetical protein